MVEAVEAAVYRPNENLPGIAFIHSLDLSFTPLTLLIKLIFFSCFIFVVVNGQVPNAESDVSFALRGL